MKRLLFAEGRRAARSPLLWLGACILIAISVFEILLSNYGYAISIAGFLWGHTPILCILLAILIPLQIGREFESRTVNHKIAAGYTRAQIYVVETVVSALCGLLLFWVDGAAVFVCARIQQLGLGESVTYGMVGVNAILGSICVVTISAIFAAIAMIAHSRLLSMGLSILLALLLLQAGGETVSALKQPEYTTDPAGEVAENPLYPTGAGRALTNIHLLVSPFAQAEYQPELLFETPDDKENRSLFFQSAAYHWDFLLVNLLELALLVGAGGYRFRRQDLK